jgi:hypothetical protein
MTPVNDFTVYWYAAQQFVHGNDPYLAAPGREYVMFAPPWTLAVIFPFGFLPLAVAQFLWLLVLAALVFVSANWLWEIYGEGRSPWLAFVLLAAFTPIWATFIMGQSSPLVLFGLAGFLRYEAKRPYVAGWFLLLAALKPQLVFLVWPTLLLTAFFEKRWQTLTGFLSALGAAMLFVFVVQPGIVAGYLAMLRTNRVIVYDTSTIATVLRHISGHVWVQFLPLVLGPLWLAWRWANRRAEWDWKAELPMLLQISFVTTTYAWFTDQVILMPAIFAALAAIRKSQIGQSALALIYLLLSAAGLFCIWTHHLFLIAWISLLWLVAYGLAVGSFNFGVREEQLT